MCNSTGHIKNQTAEEVYTFLEKQGTKERTKGIALFLIPAPEVGIMEFKVVSVEDLDLKETAKRGQMCEAFKFFPYGVELKSSDKGKVVVTTLQDIDKLWCGVGQCGNVPCYGRCFCSHWMGNCIRY